MTTSLSRRRFLGSSAAAAGTLVVGFHIPFAGAAMVPGAAPVAAPAPEVNAWVVVKPDDTVVIRIARSEMGQGSLTGLAQLVAEELDCNWAKVTTEYPTPGQNLARNRIWGEFLDRRQPRHSRIAGLRAQGRRHGADDAGAGRRGRVEGPRRGMRCRRERDHTHAFRPQDDLRQGGGRGGEVDATRQRQAEGPEGLEARRQTPGAARHGRQGHGQADLRARSQAARNGECRDQGLPGVRRQDHERRRRCGDEPQGREEGGARRRFRGGGCRRHVVAREDRARCLADRVGLRPQCQGIERRLRRRC